MFGNSQADAAAVLGRRHQPEEVVILGRSCLTLGNIVTPLSSSYTGSWLLLSGSRSIMMEGGGSAPDPFVRDQGSRSKQRKVDVRINVDIAVLPGPPGFLHDPWFRFMVVAFLVLLLLPGLSFSVLCKFTVFGVFALACWC